MQPTAKGSARAAQHVVVSAGFEFVHLGGKARESEIAREKERERQRERERAREKTCRL